MYPENPEGTQVIVGSMNMGYISDTARNRTHNLFCPKRESIPLGHSDGAFVMTMGRGTNGEAEGSQGFVMVSSYATDNY